MARNKNSDSPQPQAEQPQAEQPQAEQPQAEQPPAEQPPAEQPRAYALPRMSRKRALSSSEIILLFFRGILSLGLLWAGVVYIPSSSVVSAPTAGAITVTFSARLSNVEIDADLFQNYQTALFVYVRGTTSRTSGLQACQAGAIAKDVSWRLDFYD